MRKIVSLLLPLLLLGSNLEAKEPAGLWWNDRVFYEVFVRSFADSNSDGIGDLQGLIQRLDYLNDGDPATTDDLGVTGLWLMPVMAAASYHGYDVVDYRAIEADYGTAEDFARLIDEAHARGIAVIVDLVINHTSAQHPWFISSRDEPDSPWANFYIWADSDPGYRGPGNQPVWHPAGDRFYYGLFWDQMPDLNFTASAVTAEIHDIARFWLEEMRVDGFRIDAVKHLIEDGEAQEHTPATLTWLSEFNDYVDTVQPGALTLGEIWSGSINIAPYVPESVDLAFEFNLATTMIDAVKRRSKDGLVAIQGQALEFYPPGQYAAFLTNHDQNRAMSEFRGDVGSAKVAATLLLTNPGVPFLYYGEEIGMQGQKPDERIRTPMQWTDDPTNAGFSTGTAWEAPDSSTAEFNVALQGDDPESLLSHYRHLIHLRNASPALRRGGLTMVESSERPVYSFLRHTAHETVLVLINLNHREIADYTLHLDAGPLATGIEATWLLGTGDLHAPVVNAAGGFDNYRPVDVLPPRSSFVIQFR